MPTIWVEWGWGCARRNYYASDDDSLILPQQFLLQGLTEMNEWNVAGLGLVSTELDGNYNNYSSSGVVWKELMKKLCSCHRSQTPQFALCADNACRVWASLEKKIYFFLRWVTTCGLELIKDSCCCGGGNIWLTFENEFSLCFLASRPHIWQSCKERANLLGKYFM